MPEMTRAELAQVVGRERLRADAAEERAERLEAELQEARAGWKGGRALSPTQMRRIHKLALHQEGLDRDALWTALSDLRSLRAELDARCDKDGCEQYREWLSGEKAEADKRARQAEAERDRLAEQVRVLAGLLRRGNPKVICSKHPNHAEPGCEVCRDAGIFRSALGEQDGDQTDG